MIKPPYVSAYYQPLCTVQEVVGLVAAGLAQELLVHGLNRRVLVALPNGQAAIFGVHGVDTASQSLLSVATAGYTILLMDPTKPPCTAPTAEREQWEADPDHRAIMTCRNRLIALAVTGLAGMVNCGGRTAMDHHGTGTAFSEGTGGAVGQGSGGAGSGGAGGSGASGSGAGGGDAAAIADARNDLHEFDALLMDAEASVPSGCGCQASAGCTCT